MCCRSSQDRDLMRVVVGQDSMDRTEDREMAFNINKIFFHPDYQYVTHTQPTVRNLHHL